MHICIKGNQGMLCEGGMVVTVALLEIVVLRVIEACEVDIVYIVHSSPMQ